MRLAVVAQLLVLLLCPALWADGPSVPELISKADRPEPYPLWVSGRTAVSDGRLRSDLFSEEQLDELEYLLLYAIGLGDGLEGSSQLPEPEAECDTYELQVTKPRPAEPFPVLLKESVVAFTGVVQDRESGFLQGRLSSLLEVEVAEILKQEEGFTVPQTVLVQFGGASVVVGDKLLYTRSRRHPEEPVVGGHILVFARVLANREPLVVIPDDSLLFFETEAGSVSLPGRQRPMNPPEWDFIEERVQNLRTMSDGTFTPGRDVGGS